jgi:hypothetical protein
VGKIGSTPRRCLLIYDESICKRVKRIRGVMGLAPLLVCKTRVTVS